MSGGANNSAQSSYNNGVTQSTDQWRILILSIVGSHITNKDCKFRFQFFSYVSQSLFPNGIPNNNPKKVDVERKCKSAFFDRVSDCYLIFQWLLSQPSKKKRDNSPARLIVLANNFKCCRGHETTWPRDWSHVTRHGISYL